MCFEIMALWFLHSLNTLVQQRIRFLKMVSGQDACDDVNGQFSFRLTKVIFGWRCMDSAPIDWVMSWEETLSQRRLPVALYLTKWAIMLFQPTLCSTALCHKCFPLTIYCGLVILEVIFLHLLSHLKVYSLILKVFLSFAGDVTNLCLLWNCDVLEGLLWFRTIQMNLTWQVELHSFIGVSS